MNLRDRVIELATIERPETPVVSVYLNTRWAPVRADLWPATQATLVPGRMGGTRRHAMVEAVRDHWLIAIAVVVLVIAALMWLRGR